jgi:Tfp pilus assembly protein PilF
MNMREQPNYTLAHQDFDTALKIDPKNVKVMHGKGLAY